MRNKWYLFFKDWARFVGEATLAIAILWPIFEVILYFMALYLTGEEVAIADYISIRALITNFLKGALLGFIFSFAIGSLKIFSLIDKRW